jgi:ADP-ribose pyrophosphatase YjhB (NUDIX family)
VKLNLAYRVQKKLWKWLRPRTRGVKVMLFDDAGRLMLIRNSYGATHLFVLPGGGIRPWEKPDRAAHRELREELGCSITRLAHRSTHFSLAEGKRDTIYLFEARLAGTHEADGFEVIEAAFFPIEALPETVSPATARRVAEWLGAAEADGSW